MDAAYNSVKKTVFFVVASALLLAAPIYAQPAIVINPTLGAGNTIQIGIASCNDYQVLNLTSTSSTITVQVSVAYQAGDQNGNWLYATIPGFGTTAPGNGLTNSVFNATIPASSNTAGINLTIGLNKT